MAYTLWDAVSFPRAHDDQSEICGERSIMRVSGIKRQVESRRKLEYFGTGILQLAAQRIMLRLRDFEIRGVVESEFAPPSESLRPTPS